MGCFVGALSTDMRLNNQYCDAKFSACLKHFKIEMRVNNDMCTYAS